MTDHPASPSTGRLRLTIALATIAVLVIGGGVTAAVLLTRSASAPGAALTGATIANSGTAATVTDGDLWPNCWADDDNIYAAYGDGTGFGNDQTDIGVVRITGDVHHLGGTDLAQGDKLGQVWSGGNFTRKPTGMACVDGAIYLAVEDLRKDFNKVPASTIAVSKDHGKTWSWDKKKPMFSGGVFTTVMFLDQGKNHEHAIDGYVYAYGLDGNWRDSYSNAVRDPQSMYLARVPKDAVQDRSKWQFYTGTDAAKQPKWSKDITNKKPVLTDRRRLYKNLSSKFAGNLSVLGQGGIVYDAGLRRYIYTSWTEYTFEFYDAPHPWGPWKLFTSKDFGPYPWTDAKHGGYGLSLPSKFISTDGRSAWLQSNVCPCAPAGMNSYFFNLRTVTLK